MINRNPEIEGKDARPRYKCQKRKNIFECCIFFSFLISFRDKPSWLCFPIHLSLTLFTLKRNVSVYSLFKTDHLVMDIGIGNGKQLYNYPQN